MRDLQHVGDLADRRLPLGLRNVSHLHAEGDVLLDRHVRIERVGLKHHRDVAAARMQLVDPLAVDADFALAKAFQARRWC